jgi:hypothetical protein
VVSPQTLYEKARFPNCALHVLTFAVNYGSGWIFGGQLFWWHRQVLPGQRCVCERLPSLRRPWFYSIMRRYRWRFICDTIWRARGMLLEQSWLEEYLRMHFW